MKNLAFWISATALIGGLAIASGARDEGRMPDLDGAAGWLNSTPLSSQSLRGKVVLVNFWTYSCINSLRELPYIKAWAAKYKEAGLVVIGVHSPEFGFEKDPANVKIAVSELKVAFPVPIDSDHSIWSAFHNEYWPADYFIDRSGRIRYRHFGTVLVSRSLKRQNLQRRPLRAPCLAAEAQISPGPLSRAHAGLEGTTKCVSCHRVQACGGPTWPAC
jgi:thiol-disulfide isomerase/thioredoxin